MTTIQVKLSELDIIMAVDPAISERSTAARTAIVTAGISPYRKIFILDVWVGRQGDPARVIDTILNTAKDYMPRCIGIEMVGYQMALRPFMEREMMSRSQWWPIIELKPDHNGRMVEKKNQRILSMQPFFKTGQVYIQRGMLDLIEEYETFPLGRTLDILDALAYAFRLLVPKDDARKPALDFKLKELAKDDPSSARYWRQLAIARGDLPEEPESIEDELEEVYEGDIDLEELVR